MQYTGFIAILADIYHDIIHTLCIQGLRRAGEVQASMRVPPHAASTSPIGTLRPSPSYLIHDGSTMSCEYDAIVWLLMISSSSQCPVVIKKQCS